MIKYLFSFFSTVVFPVHRPEKTFASFPRTFGDWVIAVYVNSDKRDNFSVHFIRSFGLFPFSEDAANKINFSIMIFICDTENINTVIDENTTNFRENIFVFYSEAKRYYCPDADEITLQLIFCYRTGKLRILPMSNVLLRLYWLAFIKLYLHYLQNGISELLHLSNKLRINFRI